MALASAGSSQQRLNLALVLVGIFALALFIRSYFAYDLALRDFLVSGGSDAYYYRWIIEHVVSTGKHLITDQNLDFPVGMNNPRPPIYAWSVALTGILVGLAQGSVELGVWQSFLFSTAVWGALTIFPTYFLGRDIFGRRAGLVAAFFLAILPAHIQRTPLSNGDHDALVLFFVVTAFYFFLRALSELKEKTWVERWTNPRTIFGGLKQLVLDSRRAILFSIMSGTAIATVALTWQGWAYVPIVIIAYFIVQLLVHKLRNQDPLGVLLVFTVTLGAAHLLAGPYYMATGFVRTWFDVPLILFAAAVGLGVLVTVFHRLPWILVIPPIAFGFGAGLVIASILSPTVAAALSSGFGYFAPDKVYETIAEAQPPDLSEAILSFGAVTYYLSIFGIAWMAIQFVRKPRSDYLFALAWSAAAIFMAMLAVRFIFNASPAFALTAAWITVLLVERLGFEEVRKAVASTGASKLAAFRRGIKARHIAGALFVALLLILPNTWLAVDAAVPFEKKRDLDQEVYNSIPQPLRPSGYDGSGLFYFGAFGYSLPLKNNYFPKAWEWLGQQDAEVMPISERPAFLSWWDYGFESIQAGRHPAVADNFQNGFEFSGHFLLAQNENQAIAILNARLLQADFVKNGGQFSEAVRLAMEVRGIDPGQVQDVLGSPALYIPLIRAEPDRFGRWDDRLSARNARVIFLRTVLTEQLDSNGQADFYRDLRQATGNSIGYFAVDSRLIPFSGTNTGIFYAPAKLTDHRTAELQDLRSIPVDFYRLVAETDRGEFDFDKLPPAVTVTNIRIEYKEMFYNSMLYRIFFGHKGTDVGAENTGLPGFSGALRVETPMHGWMLRHFRLVYRTAYYNPYPASDVANHTRDWVAMSYFDALELRQKIQAGEAQGTVDISPVGNLGSGIVILKYYDGAIVRGRLTAEDGKRLPGVRVTVLDELNIPHDVATTDSQGFYSLLAPFGEVRVVASTGDLNQRAQTGNLVLGEKTLIIREEQAMREPLDLDGDGRPDYIIQVDFQVVGASVAGQAFLDLDGDGVKDSTEAAFAGQTVEVRGLKGEGVLGSALTGPNGAYKVSGLLPGSYRVVLIREGVDLHGQDVTLSVGQSRTQDLIVRPGTLLGSVLDEFSQPPVGAVIVATEDLTGQRREALIDEGGGFILSGLIEGNHTLTVEAGERGSLPETVRIIPGVNVSRDLVVRPMGEVTGRTLISFRPLPYATVALRSRTDGSGLAVKSDASGRFQSVLPEGTYDAYVLHFEDGKPHGFLGSLLISGGSSRTWDVNVEPVVFVRGKVSNPSGPVREAVITFERGGATRSLTTGQDGSFLSYLPKGTYRVWALHEASQYVASLDLKSSTHLNVSLEAGNRIEGRVFRDKDGNGTWDPGEGIEGITIQLSDSHGRSFSVITGRDGEYGVPLLSGLQYILSINAPGFAPFSRGPVEASGLVGSPNMELRPEPVQISGQLVTPDALDLTGVTVRFASLGDGAQETEDLTDSFGRVSLSALPGLYLVTVDKSISGEDVRLQALRNMTLRVPVGKPLVSFQIEVVKRVRVHGDVRILGSPFQGDLAYSGIEEGSVSVAGNFSSFLRPGNYTLHGTTTVGGQGYILLEAVQVTAPTPLNLTMVAASVLTGKLLADGKALRDPMSLNFVRSDGALLQFESGTDGSYLASLGPGDYQVSLQWRGLDSLAGVPRYVRYALQQNVNVTPGGVLERDLLVARTLDNVTLRGEITLSGQPVGAKLTLQAENATAIDTVFTLGGIFNVTVAPGQYVLYAYREAGRSVRLTTLTILPQVENILNLSLEPGYRVSGIVTIQGGARVAATLTIEAGATSLSWATDTAGAYEVFLPLGEYTLGAKVTMVERGVDVEYSYSSSLTLVASTIVNPEMSRVDLRGVNITWEAAQRARAEPGNSVVYTLTLRNTGNLDDTFRLSATVPGWNFSFDPKRVNLPFGQQNEVQVRVTIFTPLNARVEHEPLIVEVESTLDGSVRDTVLLEIDIVQFRGISLRVADEPPTYTPEALEYVLEVVNEGNGRDTYTAVLLNLDTLRSQGWEGRLVGETTEGQRLEGLVIAAQGAKNFTLRLEPIGTVSATKAALLAFSEGDDKLKSLLELQIAFPSLTIPGEGVDVQGRNIRLGAPEFPVYMYALLAVGAIGVGFLLFRRGRRRRRR